MRASFRQEGYRTVVVLSPEHGVEAMLLAEWLKYDANLITASVERYEDGQIKEMTLSASDAR